MDHKNQLSYRLNEHLSNATDEFIQENPEADVFTLIGAANIYLSSLIVNASNRQLAIKTLEECHAIQRNLINNTPDSFFGQGLRQDPDLN